MQSTPLKYGFLNKSLLTCNIYNNFRILFKIDLHGWNTCLVLVFIILLKYSTSYFSILLYMTVNTVAWIIRWSQIRRYAFHSGVRSVKIMFTGSLFGAEWNTSAETESTTIKGSCLHRLVYKLNGAYINMFSAAQPVWLFSFHVTIYYTGIPQPVSVECPSLCFWWEERAADTFSLFTLHTFSHSVI